MPTVRSASYAVQAVSRCFLLDNNIFGRDVISRLSVKAFLAGFGAGLSSVPGLFISCIEKSQFWETARSNLCRYVPRTMWPILPVYIPIWAGIWKGSNSWDKEDSAEGAFLDTSRLYVRLITRKLSFLGTSTWRDAMKSSGGFCRQLMPRGRAMIGGTKWESTYSIYPQPATHYT